MAVTNNVLLGYVLLICRHE